jgi:dsDNA-binding SOS-regulon protein
MKIRAGFVSNSSSSSFIVAFPVGFRPTAANIAAYLFAGRRGGLRLAGYDTVVSFPEAAKRIASQMRRIKPNDQARIKQALEGWLPGGPRSERFMLKGGKTDQDAWNKALDAYQAAWWAKTKPALTAHGQEDLYVFWFADNKETAEAILERGSTFAGARHVKISHH